MLDKCSNPSCSASFRFLQDGKLFRLERDPRGNNATTDSSRSRRVEYYWLCEPCASTMTLRLGDDDCVEAVALPPALQYSPASLGLFLSDRKHGLLLHSVNSWLSSSARDGPRRRWVSSSNAA